MVSRVNWAILKKDYRGFIDLSEIKRNACKFYDCLTRKKSNEAMIIKILEAEKYANNCRRLVKDICSPQENSLIKNETDNYEQMNENLGRVDLEIKTMKESTIKSLKEQGQMISVSPIVKIEDYIKIIEEALDNLAFYPLRQALNKYNNESNKFYTKEEGKNEIEIEKNKKLLIYLIYVGVLHSSESMGIPTSQKGKITKTLPNKILPRNDD